MGPRPPGFWGLPATIGIPWLVAISFQPLPLSPRGLLPIYLCVSSLLSLMRTLDLELTVNSG